jgi:predicted CXXCH cytochrome family protein
MRTRFSILSRRASPRSRRRLSGAVRAVVVVALLGAAWRVWTSTREYRLVSGAARIEPAQAVQPAPRPTGVVALSEGCVSAECHASLLPGPGAHAPDAAGACGACHLPDAGGHRYPLATRSDALCLSCHDTGRDNLVRHSALTMDGCLACHDPHAHATPALLTAEPLAQVCGDCHPPALGTSGHAPYASGECGACHDPHASDRPNLLLAAEGVDPCTTCHVDTLEWMVMARHSHLGIEGSCLACHGPHATGHDSLMVAGTRETCTRCHEEIGRTASEALVTHDAVLTGDECLACHAAHASDRPRMLRDGQRDLCLGCHGDAVIATDGRTIPAMDAIAASGGRHGPVEAGDCGACHSVHGGEHQRLLRRINPAVLAGPFDARNYALCFACHDDDLALTDGAEVTQFRQGLRNLHRVHAQSGGRSRGCADCHAIHASHLPKLIAERVAYEGSEWLMDMGYAPAADGGSCSPGCHEALSYSRLAPSDADQKEGGAP